MCRFVITLKNITPVSGEFTNVQSTSARRLIIILVAAIATLGALAPAASAAPEPAAAPVLADVLHAAAQDSAPQHAKSFAAPLASAAVTTIELGSVYVNGLTTSTVVPVAINPGPTPIAALQFEIIYDSTALTPTGCESLSGFGVCAPLEPGRIEVNAARVDNWFERTNFVAVAFDIISKNMQSTVLRVGQVDGIWTASENDVSKVDYDVLPGAVQTGDQAGSVANAEPDIAVTGSGVLTGTASFGARNAELYGAGVCAIHEATKLPRCSTTNSRGEFRIEGLLAGTYTIEYFNVDGDTASHQITGVVVANDSVAQGLDFDLTLPARPIRDRNLSGAAPSSGTSHTAQAATPAQDTVGAVLGTITASDGQPVPAVLVCATEVALGTQVCAGSRFTGEYTLAGLEPGNYVLTVVDPGQRFADDSSTQFGFDGSTTHQTDFTLARN